MMMPDTLNATLRHGLPLLASGQAQKEVTHNEAVLAIDRLLQLSVTSRSVGAPPAAPVAGDTYIVPDAASGAWAGQATMIASHDGFGWIFSAPVRGCLAWIADEGVFSVFDGAWSADGWAVSALRIGARRLFGAAPAAIAAPGGGSVVDSETRAVVGALLATLRDQGVIL
jgi:hypothetical protein